MAATAGGLRDHLRLPEGRKYKEAEENESVGAERKKSRQGSCWLWWKTAALEVVRLGDRNRDRVFGGGFKAIC